MCSLPIGHHIHDRAGTQNGDDNSDDEFGIEFTVKSGSNNDVADYKEPLSPVALECQLPWKRVVCPQETGPVTSMASHLLPNDNTPEVSQVPSWADNLDYNHIPAVSPRAANGVGLPATNGRLNTSNNNSTSNLQSDNWELPSLRERRGVPLIPTIKIDSPKCSLNNLLMAVDPYPASKDSVGRPSNGSTSDSTASSSTQPLSDSEYDESDDEEVEIIPFGKVPLSSHGSVPLLNHRSSSPKVGEEKEHPKAVMFSLANEDSSEEM